MNVSTRSQPLSLGTLPGDPLDVLALPRDGWERYRLKRGNGRWNGLEWDVCRNWCIRLKNYPLLSSTQSSIWTSPICFSEAKAPAMVDFLEIQTPNPVNLSNCRRAQHPPDRGEGRWLTKWKINITNKGHISHSSGRHIDENEIPIQPGCGSRERVLFRTLVLHRNKPSHLAGLCD